MGSRRGREPNRRAAPKSKFLSPTIVDAFLHGETAEEIAQQYPSLRLADVYAVIAFYLRRRSDVDSYLHERQRQANAVRAENEVRFDPSGVRDRLLARHADTGQ